jgi:hypothetical protein
LGKAHRRQNTYKEATNENHFRAVMETRKLENVLPGVVVYL